MPHPATLEFCRRLDPRLVTGAVDDPSGIAVATLGGAAPNSAPLDRVRTLLAATAKSLLAAALMAVMMLLTVNGPSGTC